MLFVHFALAAPRVFPPLPPGPPAQPPIPIFDPAPTFSVAARAPPESEGRHYDKYKPCSTFRDAFLCGIEEDEWTLARALITPERTVLELGARYGTTSCVVSQATNNSGFVASVEIDSTVYGALRFNRFRHRCNFLIVRGAVSRHNLYQFSKSDHYGNRAWNCNSTSRRHNCKYSGFRTIDSYRSERLRRGMPRAIPNVPFEEVERQLGRPIDTLLVDCEGCINSLLEGQLYILRGIRLILMEEDMYAFVDYVKVHHTLKKEGFERIWQIKDTYDRRPGGTYAWWSKKQVHSVWQRVGITGTPSCSEYKARMGITDDRLLCA